MFELLIIDYMDLILYIFQDIGFNYWIYFLQLGLFNVYVRIFNFKIGVDIVFIVKEVFIYYMFLFVKFVGVMFIDIFLFGVMCVVCILCVIVVEMMIVVDFLRIFIMKVQEILDILLVFGLLLLINVFINVVNQLFVVV